MLTQNTRNHLKDWKFIIFFYYLFIQKNRGSLCFNFGTVRWLTQTRNYLGENEETALKVCLMKQVFWLDAVNALQMFFSVSDVRSAQKSPLLLKTNCPIQIRRRFRQQLSRTLSQYPAVKPQVDIRCQKVNGEQGIYRELKLLLAFFSFLFFFSFPKVTSQFRGGLGNKGCMLFLFNLHHKSKAFNS